MSGGIATEKKRKTVTSYEVKKRHRDKTYRNYSIWLRYDSDAELIDFLESNKEQGISPAETFRRLFQK